MSSVKKPKSNQTKNKPKAKCIIVTVSFPFRGIFYHISANKGIIKFIYCSAHVFLIEKYYLKTEFSSLVLSRSKAVLCRFVSFAH